MVIPSLENNSNVSCDCKRFKTYGPAKTPVRMYPTIKGCLRYFITNEMRVASARTMLISRKTGIV